MASAIRGATDNASQSLLIRQYQGSFFYPVWQPLADYPIGINLLTMIPCLNIPPNHNIAAIFDCTHKVHNAQDYIP